MIKILFTSFRIYLKKVYLQSKWRKSNRHNSTVMGNIFEISRVKVKNCSYGELTVRTYARNNTKLIIGNCCSIASNVVFILDGEHSLNKATTFPINNNFITKGDIIIGDDCWIGERAIFLSGIEIGQGAFIGAGAIVTKDVPPYSIYVGVQEY